MRLSNAITDSNGVTRTEEYGYDELYRLTDVDYDDGETQSYTFDPMGNRLTKGSENYSYNNANMLLTRGASTYTNDANGNTLTGGGRTNTWDSQNRLRQCVYGGTTECLHIRRRWHPQAIGSGWGDYRHLQNFHDLYGTGDFAHYDVFGSVAWKALMAWIERQPI